MLMPSASTGLQSADPAEDGVISRESAILAEEQTLPTAFATMRRAGSSLQPGVPVNRLLKFPRGKFMMVSG